MVAGLERQFPSTPRYLLGVPRYLWRQAAADAVDFVRALGPRGERARFAAETRMLWFAGFLRGSWLRGLGQTG